jgi:hypothetical protein
MFAVECKFRSSTDHNGFVKLSKEKQISRYRSFKKERSIGVYIVLGLGGEPTAPDELFVIPLEDLHFATPHYSWLKKFEKNTHYKFFFDPVMKRLS